MNVLVSPVALAAPQWIIDLLSGGSIYTLAQQLWNFVMGIALTLLGKNVSDFSGSSGAWTYIRDTVFPLFLSMGSVFLSMFTLAGFCRQASNLKEGITMEAWIELFIKLVVSNVLMANSLSIMQEFTGFAIKTSNALMISSVPDITGGDYDAGFRLAMLLLAPIYLIVAGTCSIIILIEVLGRFLNLFLLIATAPAALSTIAGGRGFENTASAWFKSFLTITFQIVIIVIAIQIATRLNLGITNFMNTSTLASWFNGAGAVIGSLIFMPFMATAVKTSDNFLKRAFDLR